MKRHLDLRVSFYVFSGTVDLGGGLANMNTGEKHFEKKDIQTILKHILLKDYMNRWATVFMKAAISKQIKKCHFVDCFAGEGSFKDGQDGSPLIAIKNLFNLQRAFHEKYDNKCRFFIHTVELNDDYHQKLVQMGKNSSFPTQINNYCGEFKNHVQKLVKSTFGSPALYFIDPFGYKGVHLQDIQKILAVKSHEVLINVMSYSLVRNYRIQNNHSELCKFFGVHEIPENIKEYIKLASNDKVLDTSNSRSLFKKLENDIIELYSQKLRQSFDHPVYILSKRIYSPINPNVYFHLVFTTKNRAGLIEMKNTMVTFESLRIKAEEDYIRTNSIQKNLPVDDLFSEAYSIATYDYIDFVREFMKIFNNEKCTYGQVIDHFLQYTPLPFSDNENQKSIADFCARLFEKNKYIERSSRAFKNYKVADDFEIYSRLPDNYLKSISIVQPESEQLSIFNFM